MLFTLKAASFLVNIILFFQNPALSSASCCRDESEDESCLDLIPVGYKKHLAPPGLEGQPLNVTFAITIIDIDEINTGTMDFRIHGYIFNNWIDDRLLVSNTEIVNAKCSHYIWVPDMVFETAKSAQQFGNRFLYIDKDKNVTLAERYAFKVGCLMNFENYPFRHSDLPVLHHSQSKSYKMSSTDKEVNPQWNDLNGNEPISFFKNIEPLQFHLGKPTTYTMKLGYNGASYTYLYMSIHLMRRLTGSIINIYLPSTLIVAVSWVTFWLRVEAAPARVALIVTSLLTLCTQVQQNKSLLPPLNYITAVDIWLFVCILMIFSSLIEFAFCYSSYSSHKTRKHQVVDVSEEVKTISKIKCMDQG
ncbi:glycine receptor subunit alpha-3 [Caerostris extrusa]|uniref:Glycine receptor subunit alpha-3 n=1 Tax=Caerostris extrusa TaxID=172846 RepID=A0AAV4QVF5_CAEEX|nr:glycine receptor subunit alpha-3 [Caerostris extrusa]